MVVLFWVCVFIFLAAAIGAFAVSCELKRDDLVMVEDTIERNRVKKFLGLTEEAQKQIEMEIDNGFHDRKCD